MFCASKAYSFGNSLHAACSDQGLDIRPQATASLFAVSTAAGCAQIGKTPDEVMTLHVPDRNPYKISLLSIFMLPLTPYTTIRVWFILRNRSAGRTRITSSKKQ